MTDIEKAENLLGNVMLIGEEMMKQEKGIEKFFKVFQNSWHNHRYAQENDLHSMEAQLYDDNYIEHATLKECRDHLSFILRGDKFCDGYWFKAARDGRVQAILRRLTVIREEG